MKGRKPKPFQADGDVRASIVDADSGVMSSKKMSYLQGYNVQAMATHEQVVVAAEIANNAADVGQLHPMIAAADQALRAAGVTERSEPCLLMPASSARTT